MQVGKSFKMLLLLPFYQITNIFTYARAQKTWTAKILTPISFFPVVMLSLICWIALLVLLAAAAEKIVMTFR